MTDTPYRPATGTEGADFEDAMCTFGCKHYRPDELYEPGYMCNCDLGFLTGAFVHPIDAPEYPRQWVVRDGYPLCTAREEIS